MVAQLLEFLVPLHLRRHGGVRAVVRSRLGDLIRGQVDAVHLSGDGWETRAGLTAQRLTVAALEGAKLSYSDLLGGRLVLTMPALGWAEALFEPVDFGNFLVYGPVAAAAPTAGGRRITFEREGVEFDQVARRVFFAARCMGKRVPFVLEAGGGDGDHVLARVLGSTVEVPEAEALGAAVTRFFRTLLIDLGGVELRFAAMSFDSFARLRLRLRATIRRIPNPLTDRI